MKTYTSLLEETLEAWTDVRQGLIEEAKNIPGSKFDFRPSPGMRSVTELIHHILEVALLMTGELCRPDTNFHREPWDKLIAPYAARARKAATKEALLDLLRTSYRESERKFLEFGELAVLQMMTRFDGKRGTRLAWLNHGIGHEMYHTGQLTAYARLLGRVPALTQQIQGG
ncbi:MAG: DinB family protein [Acidobacteria bacterium]|nr:DinB family protein [Acidobacteriota bacterium]